MNLMSTEYYFVCDECEEISNNAITRTTMMGGFICKDNVMNFLTEHFLDRGCPRQGIRIVPEQSPEEENYKNITNVDGRFKGE